MIYEAIHETTQSRLVVEGESKRIHYIGAGNVRITLKPTIYSYTHNRGGEIPGSDRLRLRAISALLPIIRDAGIEHTYQSVDNTGIISTLVLQPTVDGDTPPFVPDDLTADQIGALPKATPLEVVVKAIHSGTPKHRYYRFSDYPLRDGRYVPPDSPYPDQIVRFDWRNPLMDDSGRRLADEILPESMADWYINVTAARQTALTAFAALNRHLSGKGLTLWDICFFIAEDGKTMFGEISPDCLRVRAQDGTALDKDIWRSGGSSDQILTKWQQFVELLENT